MADTIADYMAALRASLGAGDTIQVSDALLGGINADMITVRNRQAAAVPVTATLLNAVTTLTTGADQNVSALLPSNHAWSVEFGGTITAATVVLRGKITSGGASVDLDTSTATANAVREVTGKPAAFVHADVTVLTGIAPTVSVNYIGSR